MREIGESSSDLRDDNGISVRRTNVTIPHDLMLEIMARLPAKSLARFLCVSKLWESTIRRSRAFATSFAAQSSTRPGFLFVLVDKDIKTFSSKLSFFSSSMNPRNPYTEESPPSVRLHSLNSQYCLITMYHSVRGLICLGSYNGYAIFNPSLRRFVTLPVMDTNTSCIGNHCFLGYDPIGNEYKAVLSLDYTDTGRGEIRVLTLGDRGWRRIEGVRSHFPIRLGRCVDGVLYYKAFIDDYDNMKLVCFDVRSEGFSFVDYPKGFRNRYPSSLINYKGKLAEIQYDLEEAPSRIRLFVLEDAEKQEWSEKVFLVPSTLRGLIQNSNSFFNVSSTDAGEIVFMPSFGDEPSFVLYYNSERNSLEKVELDGITRGDNRTHEGRKGMFVTLGDHVESIMFL